MELINKLLYRRFSKDEYKQLREILGEETKIFRRRPQFIIGHILMFGLMFYFLVRAFIPESFQLPKTGDMVGVVFGAAVGVFVGWLIFKLLKAKGPPPKIFLPFMFFWIVFCLMTIIQPSSQTKWEYFIYSILTLSGWLCCCGSIKEHFCEKIFTSRKKMESPVVN